MYIKLMFVLLSLIEGIMMLRSRTVESVLVILITLDRNIEVTCAVISSSFFPQSWFQILRYSSPYALQLTWTRIVPPHPAL